MLVRFQTRARISVELGLDERRFREPEAAGAVPATLTKFYVPDRLLPFVRSGPTEDGYPTINGGGDGSRSGIRLVSKSGQRGSIPRQPATFSSLLPLAGGDPVCPSPACGRGPGRGFLLCREGWARPGLISLCRSVRFRPLQRDAISGDQRKPSSSRGGRRSRTRWQTAYRTSASRRRSSGISAARCPSSVDRDAPGPYPGEDRSSRSRGSVRGSDLRWLSVVPERTRLHKRDSGRTQVGITSRGSHRCKARWQTAYRTSARRRLSGGRAVARWCHGQAELTLSCQGRSPSSTLGGTASHEHAANRIPTRERR